MNNFQRCRKALRAAACAAAMGLAVLPAPGQPAPHVVISEIYGGGGNSGAVYTHDFIELYNPTTSDVDMDGWSVQYQSGGGAGPFGAIAKLSGVIASHGFYLIQANPGSGGTLPLPAPDAVAGFAMAAASGKVALSADTLPVTAPADSGVVDFVGYGTSNLFEGAAPAIAPGNTTSVERKASASSDAGSMSPGGGEEHAGNARDSDENLDDFIRREPEPQNGASPGEAPGGALSVAVPYAGQWNLVSLPVAVADSSAEILFPDAVTPLYRYESGYVPESAAVTGTGYWIRFASPETVVFSGIPAGPETLDLAAGWNLIGASSGAVAAGSVLQVPSGHLAGAFFGYDSGYRPADTLRPGRAYWVRSSTGGSIVLAPDAGGAAPAPVSTAPR